MSHAKRRKVLLAVLQLALPLVFTCALAWRYWIAEAPAATSSAETLPVEARDVWNDSKRTGYTLAEAGPYGGRQFRSARRRAIENLRVYERLQYAPLGQWDELARQLLPRLSSQLVGKDSITSASIPAEEWREALARRLAADLLVLKGSSLEEHLERVGSPACRWPFNQDAFLALLNEYNVSHPAPDEEDSSALRQTVADYWQHRTRVAGDGLVESASFVGKGFAYAVGHATQAEPAPPLLDPLLSVEDRAVLFGSLAQAGYVCYEPAAVWEEALRSGASIPVAKVVVVCATKGGSDRYPVVFYYWYDQDANRWWLRWMTRQSSILMAQTVPPIH